MKKILIALAVLALAGSAYAAQKSDATLKDVRNPRVLAKIINANAADAESRLTSGSTSADSLTLINTADTGTASVLLQADAPLGVADDAGDKYGIVATDGSGLEIQSDASSKGTLATKASIENDGLITTLVGIDAIGAVDFDIGSADVTDVTVTTDGGTVVLDGSVTASSDLVGGNDLTLTRDAAIGRNATVAGTLAVTGVATFTAESVHNLGIDADYITVDAAAGIDTKTAGTLMVGASTATKVEIADSGVETEVQGALDAQNTLAVAGAATLASTLAVTGDTTLSADVAVSSNLAVTGTSTLGGTVVLNAIDTTGAADIDIGSADVTDVTVVTDNGTVIIDGGITLGSAAVLDATGAVDMDYGSADITDHTFTSDGGTVILDGDVTCDSVIFADAATASPTNAASAGFAVTVNGTNYWLALYPAND